MSNREDLSFAQQKRLVEALLACGCLKNAQSRGKVVENKDKPLVEQLAVALEKERVSLFLDKWQLVPGDPSQEKLVEALDSSATCAVFLGPNGLGPWENEEMRTALDERVRDKTVFGTYSVR